jgi:hypothetical protein
MKSLPELKSVVVSLAVIAAFGLSSSAQAACPNGQQAYYTSDGGTPPAAVEHCRRVYDHGNNGVAWTGNLDQHLTPVMTDHDSDPLTPDVPLVLDGKPIVTASGASNGDHQHDEPVVKGINGVAVGNGAMVGEWVPASNGGTPNDPSDDVPGHYRYVDGGTALGADAKVTHQGSTALGAGAKSTDTDQVTLGTQKDTIKAPGITSQKSKDRQQGSLEVVTSDSEGRLATDGGAIFNQLGEYGSRLDSHSAMLSAHSKKLEEHSKGIAIAMSLPDAWLESNKRFAIAGSLGGFDDQTAIGAAAIFRLDETWTVNGKLGSDTDFEQFGWTVGARASW